MTDAAVTRPPGVSTAEHSTIRQLLLYTVWHTNSTPYDGEIISTYEPSTVRMSQILPVDHTNIRQVVFATFSIISTWMDGNDSGFYEQ